MRHPTQLHSGTIPWPKIKIMVFSQDEAFRFLARQTFRKLNVREVLSAGGPADAAKVLAQAPDIGLVDTDGDLDMALAFLEQVRSADADLPVLLVAKTADRPRLAHALTLGVDGVVPKPISGHELIHRTGDSLKAPRRQPAPPPPPPLDTPAEIGGGPRWTDGDLASLPAKKAGSYADDDIPAARPAATGTLEALSEGAEAERADWQAELTAAGHRPRRGKDVAGLDVGAIVAAHLLWLTSQGGQGKRADFRKLDLAGAALAGTVLANAGFREAELSDARLAEARLDGADFRHASLNAADLSAANLGVAQLRHCDLRLANLQGASLRGADLSGARLGGAKLAGADFKGALLVGCDLSGADLSQVDDLAPSQLEKALFDPKTKLPPGMCRPREI